MKNQRGAISGTVMGILVGVGIVCLIVAVISGSYISYYNVGARSENAIKAQYENMENILAQYGTKIKEAAQIPNMQVDGLRKLFSGALESRYGKNGSQATMQWIKEQNPNLDQTTYLKLQQLIEAGRNKFENAQTRFIDAKRSYKTNLDLFWSGMWLKFAGYPKIDLDKYKIISSSHAKKAFETGIDDGVQFDK